MLQREGERVGRGYRGDGVDQGDRGDWVDQGDLGTGMTRVTGVIRATV